jgi:hypothetical protein
MGIINWLSTKPIAIGCAEIGWLFNKNLNTLYKQQRQCVENKIFCSDVPSLNKDMNYMHLKTSLSIGQIKAWQV